MRNLGKRLFEIITIVLVCSTVLSSDGRICRAAGENPVADGSSTISELPTVDENPTVGEVYSTALEAAYGDTFRSVYENRLAGSPLEADPADGVDPATGHLMLTRTDLTLDGTGGMDFELARYYDSNEANLGHATVEQVSELRRDTVWVGCTAQDGTERELIVCTALLKNHKDALKNLTGTSYRVIKKQHDDVIRPEGGTQRTKTVSNEGHSVYGLAAGWRYDFPWIETVTLTEDGGWGKDPAYLHCGSAGVIRIVTEPDETTKSYHIKGLEGYGYQDIKLEDFDQTVDGIPCKYLLRDKTGRRTYFNADGVIVLQKDAHGNTITYTYTDGIHFRKITDSVGREIRFHYSGEDGEKVITSVTVQGKDVKGGVPEQTVTYETEERSYTPLYGDRLHGATLTSATVDGSRETYSYKTAERLVNTAGAGAASHRISTDQSYLLEKTAADGSETCYEYRACSLRGTRKDGAGQDRDVVTEQFYVTREYEKDTKTGKKSDGVKYDYFQKKGGDSLRSYDDFREREGEDGEIFEAWQYGNSGLRAVTVVSSFNPNKYKPNKKYYDYTYKKEKIDPDTLHLKKDTKKNVTLYIYNENKLLTEEIRYGSEKEETLYTYDKGGKGSLVVLEAEKTYGKKGNRVLISKQGYTYDTYRSLLTSRSPRAYLAKNKGKEHLYTTTYAYHGTDKGYPAGDKAFVCPLVAQESYTGTAVKSRWTASLAANGTDYASIAEQRSVDGGAYRTITKTDFQYDAHGNEIQGTVYPSYSTDGEKEAIRNNYTYNDLGQQTKTTVTTASSKRPQDSRTYTEEETTYDSFGNELTCTDENGLVSKTSYDPETGEETETIRAMGTEYESKEKEYQSADGLKTMTVDPYGRVSITIQDGFGNTILSKDEAAGTWTESIYEYGSADGEDDGDSSSDGEGDNDPDNAGDSASGIEKEVTARLIEERTYAFTPDEKRFLINEDGETVPNYHITGKGKKILSGSKHFYDNLGSETGSASFQNGELDAAHCTAWSFSKSESEVTGEGDGAQTISISFSKTLDPAEYQPEADPDHYYGQFNDAVLSETITKTITDAGGNTLSQTTTTIRGKNRKETVTTYESDDFGRTVKEQTVTRKQQDGTWLPAYETQVLSAYDETGNVSQTETKSRKEGETEWQSRTVKTDYNEQGQAVREYTPRGIRENAATNYEYDILGRMVQSETPQKKENGSIRYQKTTTEYDKAGNVTEKSEQVDADRTAKTGYTYDKQGNLVMVKSSLEDGNAQYVQYVYDPEGNKVRQYTGMTAPLTITVTEVKDAAEDADTFSYAGKTWQITVSGKKKTDTIRETKYEYDGKNQLTAYTDPEGRRETYTYDENSNLTRTVDKNGNIQKNTYDYQNRLIEMVAKEKKTGKETTHTYTYNAYGETASQDSTAYHYDDADGQMTKETTKLTKYKTIEKNYTYDSAGNKNTFAVTVGGDTKLSQQYTYDGESKVTAVMDEKGNQVAGYAYDMDGNLSKRTIAGNRMTTSYTYDYQNHLTAMENRTGSSGVISRYTSEYLVNGQKAKEASDVTGRDGKKSTKTATYTYDLLGHIIKETRTGSKDITYTYDSNNNRKTMTAGNRVTAYKYNKNDELLRTDTLNTDTEKDTVVIYKNDRNGNQLATVNRYEIPEEKKGKPYIDIDVTLGSNRLNKNVVNHYNAENQLVRTLTKNYKVSFTYDAEGLRTSKTVNGEKTVYVWDGDQLVLELGTDGKVKKRYVRGTDLVYADRGEGNASGEAYEKQYYVTDPHGNVVQLTDGEGTVTKMYEYDSFGNEVKPEEKDDNPFRYCGEYYDKETGEVYLRARYYQPEKGRFLTRDTYTGEEDEPESLHLYAYCGNDGVNAWDPSGHMPTDLEAVYMCKYVSAKSGTLTGGWKFKRYLGKKKGKKFIGLYYKKSTKEYCIANKGTSPKNFSDWKNNVQQPIGKSKDMKLSIKEAKKFVKKHKKREITFIGHSKGGAEAAANAVATNRNCITFNPAVVNYKKYNLNPYRYTAHMTTYIVQGDILNTLEGGFRGFSGKIIYLPKQYGKGWYYGGGLSVAFGVKNHLLDAVEKALKSIQGGGGGGGSW